jgi:putative sterol carrier protein
MAKTASRLSHKASPSPRQARSAGRAKQADPDSSDAIIEFFAKLEARDHEPLLARARGTLRFDLRDGGRVDRWYVTVDRGHIEVSRQRQDADAIFTSDRDLFVGIVEGRVNATAATLRGDVQLSGDLNLPMAMQRVLPGPPDAQGPSIPSRKVPRA